MVKNMNKIKTILMELGSFMLTNERINTQTCAMNSIDTTKTITDYKGK